MQLRRRRFGSRGGLVALGLASLAGLASLTTMGCRGRPRAWEVPVGSDKPRERGAVILELDLAAGAPERSKSGFLTLPSHHTFDVLVAALHQALDRKDVLGVFVSFGGAGLGWARAHELGDGLRALRDKGIPVVCHADAWENTAYAAAARGCDVIAMSPAGEVEATGPASSLPYAREFLEDKLHAQVDILQVGKFKGAAEPLTRDGPSEEYRASIERALKALREADVQSLTARGVEASIGEGPFAGDEATKHHLVDSLGDRNAARELLKQRAGNAPIDVIYGPSSEAGGKGLSELVKMLAPRDAEAAAQPHVALVRLEGEIALGGEGGILGGPAGIVARQVVADAHRLAKDPNVKAVVLRIDSPGGSALGSDLAWIAVHELEKEKPVIVSIGEMAASGGYYIASAGTSIFAQPESIVGSIGVVGGKVSFGGTLAMVGVHTASFGDPRAVQLGSLFEPWDDATRARLLGTMNTIYALFLDRVAEGRKKPKETFTDAVEGRVFGGLDAKELGLVDEIGGLGVALAAAKRAGHLPESAPVVTDGGTEGILDLLGDATEARALDTALGPIPAGAAPELVALRRWLLTFVEVTRGGRVAAMLPWPLLVR